MLGQSLTRWANIKPAFAQSLVLKTPSNQRRREKCKKYKKYFEFN